MKAEIQLIVLELFLVFNFSYITCCIKNGQQKLTGANDVTNHGALAPFNNIAGVAGNFEDLRGEASSKINEITERILRKFTREPRQAPKIFLRHGNTFEKNAIIAQSTEFPESEEDEETTVPYIDLRPTPDSKILVQKLTKAQNTLKNKRSARNKEPIAIIIDPNIDSDRDARQSKFMCFCHPDGCHERPCRHQDGNNIYSWNSKALPEDKEYPYDEEDTSAEIFDTPIETRDPNHGYIKKAPSAEPTKFHIPFANSVNFDQRVIVDKNIRAKQQDNRPSFFYYQTPKIKVQPNYQPNYPYSFYQYNPYFVPNFGYTYNGLPSIQQNYFVTNPKAVTPKPSDSIDKDLRNLNGCINLNGKTVCVVPTTIKPTNNIRTSSESTSINRFLKENQNEQISTSTENNDERSSESYASTNKLLRPTIPTIRSSTMNANSKPMFLQTNKYSQNNERNTESAPTTNYEPTTLNSYLYSDNEKNTVYGSTTELDYFDNKQSNQKTLNVIKPSIGLQSIKVTDLNHSESYNDAREIYAIRTTVPTLTTTAFTPLYKNENAIQNSNSKNMTLFKTKIKIIEGNTVTKINESTTHFENSSISSRSPSNDNETNTNKNASAEQFIFMPLPTLLQLGNILSSSKKNTTNSVKNSTNNLIKNGNQPKNVSQLITTLEDVENNEYKSHFASERKPTLKTTYTSTQGLVDLTTATKENRSPKYDEKSIDNSSDEPYETRIRTEIYQKPLESSNNQQVGSDDLEMIIQSVDERPSTIYESTSRGNLIHFSTINPDLSSIPSHPTPEQIYNEKLLEITIKKVLNNFVPGVAQDLFANYRKENMAELVNAHNQELLPEILDMPILKNLFLQPEVENMIIDITSDLLSQVTGEPVIGNVPYMIKNVLHNVIDSFPLPHPTIAPMTINDQPLYDSQWVTERITTLQKASTISSVRNAPKEVFNKIENIINRSSIGQKAASHPVIQNLIIKAIKHSLDKEKGVIDESTIRQIFNLLIQQEPQIFNQKQDGIQNLPSTQLKKANIFQQKITTDYSTVPIDPVAEPALYGEQRFDSEKNPVKKSHSNYLKPRNIPDYQEFGIDEINQDSIKDLKSMDYALLNEEIENLETMDAGFLKSKIDESVELKPIKYHSDNDGLVEYIKNHENSDIPQSTALKRKIEPPVDFVPKTAIHYPTKENSKIITNSEIPELAQFTGNVNYYAPLFQQTTPQHHWDLTINRKPLKHEMINTETYKHKEQHFPITLDKHNNVHIPYYTPSLRQLTPENHWDHTGNRKPLREEVAFTQTNKNKERHHPYVLDPEINHINVLIESGKISSKTSALKTGEYNNKVKSEVSIKDHYHQNVHIPGVTLSEFPPQNDFITDSPIFKDSLYLGRLVPLNFGKSQIKNTIDLRSSKLIYVGDGIRLPLAIRKLPDSTFALTFSDEACKQFMYKKCPCCLPTGSNGLIVNEARNDQIISELNFSDDGVTMKIPSKRDESKGSRIRRDSGEVFEINSDSDDTQKTSRFGLNELNSFIKKIINFYRMSGNERTDVIKNLALDVIKPESTTDQMVNAIDKRNKIRKDRYRGNGYKLRKSNAWSKDSTTTKSLQYDNSNDETVKNYVFNYQRNNPIFTKLRRARSRSLLDRGVGPPYKYQRYARENVTVRTGTETIKNVLNLVKDFIIAGSRIRN